MAQCMMPAARGAPSAAARRSLHAAAQLPLRPAHLNSGRGTLCAAQQSPATTTTTTTSEVDRATIEPPAQSPAPLVQLPQSKHSPRSAISAAAAAARGSLAAAAAFAATAAAVFGTPTTPLAALDTALHRAVAEHTTAAFRAHIAEALVSNAAIDAALLGWAVASAAALAAAPRAAAPRLALAWALYLSAAGAVGSRDPPLVAELKAAFARARPSQELHHSYSFPSGHATAAAFMAGALMLALIPLARRLWTARHGGGGSGGGSGSSDSSVWDLPPGLVVSTWLALWAVTASGRVLADAHWFSDTLAGGAIGAACALALAAVFHGMDAIEQRVKAPRPTPQPTDAPAADAVLLRRPGSKDGAAATAGGERQQGP